MSSETERANLRFIKDYVTCHGTAPTHTSTYSRGTFPEDQPWDFDVWRDQFRIKVLQMSEDEELVFDMTGIDVSLANAFRRILLAEVPTMAIEKVFVHNNTGVLRDELVAQRLGMIPIKADPSFFEWPGDEAKDADEHSDLAPLDSQVLKFRLKVKCRKAAGGADNEPINGKVLSNQLEWIPVGDQAERFAHHTPEPVHEDILIARLRPGQEIDMEMHCHKGNNNGDTGHAKWSPVATAWYRLLPRIDILQDMYDDEADKLVERCPMNCFDIEETARHRKAIVSETGVRDCTLCRECIREPDMAKKLRLARKKDHFIFTVESTGILPAQELFKQSVQILRAKAKRMLDLLEQLEGELAVQAMEEDADVES
eukprot:Tamp_10875.p1 GENE.Tamp_10875~~Tamp_10875.p1  ORF type:complete len:433 (-),score=99.04 Tamp_10875:687-1796(-)